MIVVVYFRFNGYDNRLTRMTECALLVMEAFKGFEDIFQFEIIGHSGEEYKLQLTDRNQPPKNEKERIDVLRMMHLHSQFCASGDHTLEATHDAIESFEKELEDCDEAFVLGGFWVWVSLVRVYVFFDNILCNGFLL